MTLPIIVVVIIIILVLRLRPGFGEQDEYQPRPALPWCEECFAEESVVRVGGERLCFACAEMREVLT